MKPPSLSASAFDTYLNCPKAFEASYVVRARDLSGDAATLGTVCHEVLERLAKEGKLETADMARISVYYEEVYNKHFDVRDFFKDGMEMLSKWHARQDWTGRTVVEAEVKKNFMVKVKKGVEIPVNYIMDRVDRLDNGDIQVIDYKTYRIPLNPEDLRGKIQPRLYAAAMTLEYPDAEHVWVIYDMLRHDTIGVRFSKAECLETLDYLTSLAKTIWKDKDPAEVINTTCRWCIRALKCEALQKHASVGGALAITDIDEALKLRYKMKEAEMALKSKVNDLDSFILAEMQRLDTMDYETGSDVGDVKVSIKSRKTKKIDPRLAANIIGHELMADFGNISAADVEKLIKSGMVDDEQAARLQKLITLEVSRPWVDTKPVSSHDED